jgi:hypothetical protein
MLFFFYLKILFWAAQASALPGGVLFAGAPLKNLPRPVLSLASGWVSEFSPFFTSRLSFEETEGVYGIRYGQTASGWHGGVESSWYVGEWGKQRGWAVGGVVALENDKAFRFFSAEVHTGVARPLKWVGLPGQVFLLAGLSRSFALEAGQSRWECRGGGGIEWTPALLSRLWIQVLVGERSEASLGLSVPFESTHFRKDRL